MIHRSSLAPRIKTFTPVGSKVLVRRHARAEKIGDILMPQIASRIDMARFDVLRVGPKCETVKVGDVALAGCQLQFTRIELDGEKLEVAPEELFSAVIPA